MDARPQVQWCRVPRPYKCRRPKCKAGLNIPESNALLGSSGEWRNLLEVGQSASRRPRVSHSCQEPCVQLNVCTGLLLATLLHGSNGPPLSYIGNKKPADIR